jgi:hypothetical protein
MRPLKSWAIVSGFRSCQSRLREAVSCALSRRNQDGSNEAIFAIARQFPETGVGYSSRRSTNEGLVMWDILIAAVSLCCLIETAEEWRRRRVANRELAQMRNHVQSGHRWDATLGRWLA